MLATDNPTTVEATAMQKRRRRTANKVKSTAQMKKELLERQLTEPVFVKKGEYERALNATFRKYERGLKDLERVKKVLAKAAATADSKRDARALCLAIEKVDDSVVAFGWSDLPYQYRNKKRMMIWPAAEKAKTKKKRKH